MFSVSIDWFISIQNNILCPITNKSIKVERERWFVSGVQVMEVDFKPQNNLAEHLQKTLFGQEITTKLNISEQIVQDTTFS